MCWRGKKRMRIFLVRKFGRRELQKRRERSAKEETKLLRVKDSGNAMWHIVRMLWKNFPSKWVDMLIRNCVYHDEGNHCLWTSCSLFVGCWIALQVRWVKGMQCWCVMSSVEHKGEGVEWGEKEKGRRWRITLLFTLCSSPNFPIPSHLQMWRLRILCKVHWVKLWQTMGVFCRAMSYPSSLSTNRTDWKVAGVQNLRNLVFVSGRACWCSVI